MWKQLKNQPEGQIISQQLQSAGWDEAAINGYLKNVVRRSKNFATSKQNVAHYYKETFAIGSPSYLALYRASRLSAREKITLVLHQLEAEIDAYHFMHLLSETYYLDENLPPHASFYAYFRRDVWWAFSTKDGLNNDELGIKSTCFGPILIVKIFRIFGRTFKVPPIMKNYWLIVKAVISPSIIRPMHDIIIVRWSRLTIHEI